MKLNKVDDKTAYENLLVEYAELENKIADIKANCDLAIEGRDVKIKELEEENKRLLKENSELSARIERVITENAELKEENNKLLDVINNQDVKIADLEKQIERENNLNQVLSDHDEQLRELIEKMKCCENCKYGYCGWSSESIDKDGNRTCHAWNKEKQKYCDIGKNGKYQCWEIKEND